MRMMTTVAIRPWREPAVLDDIVEMCRKSATTDVAIMMMCHPEGLPLMKKIEESAEQFLRIKARLSTIGVRTGILFQTLLDHGERFHPRSPVTFQRIVGFDGTVSQSCFCPLDANFLEYIREMVTHLSKQKPDFFLVDDDTRLDNHAPARWSCACPLHVDAFNHYGKLNYTREQIFETMQRDDETGLTARHTWQESGLKSLVDFSKIIRSVIDTVDPSIRCGKCVSGGATMLTSEPIARALAGNTKPFMRLCGAIYMHPGHVMFPDSMMFIAVQKSLLTDGIELLCEADTCLHTLYHTSTKSLRGFIAGSILIAGIDTPYTWIPSVLEWVQADVDAYSDALKSSLPFFEALHTLSKRTRWLGPTTITNGHRKISKPWHESDSESCLPSPWGHSICGRLGIPFAVNDSDASVSMLDGDAVYDLTPKELEKVFSKGVLLDGAAALILAKQGYSEWMGVDVREGDETLRFDFEKFGDDAALHGKSRGKYAYAPHNQPQAVKWLTPLSDETQVASAFMASPWYNSTEQHVVSPALTVFQNKLGGRVAVCAHVLSPSMAAYSFLGATRKEQLTHLLSWLGQKHLPAIAQTIVDTYFLYGFNESAKEYTVGLFNLNPDDIEPLEIQFDFGKPSGVLKLTDAGQWEAIAFTFHEGVTRFEINIQTMQPLILRVKV